jgi:uncharacterized membrane protein YtjA (UPF0391 family)
LANDGLRAAQACQKENTMLYYAAVFFVIALIAGAFGFTGVATGAAGIAKFLFGLFVLLFLVTVVLALAGISIFA